MGLYPPGSRVELSNGLRGTVIAAGEDIELPKVRASHESDGRLLPERDQRVIDLAEPFEGERLTVAKLFVDGTPKQKEEEPPPPEEEDIPELPCAPRCRPPGPRETRLRGPAGPRQARRTCSRPQRGPCEAAASSPARHGAAAISA